MATSTRVVPAGAHLPGTDPLVVSNPGFFELIGNFTPAPQPGISTAACRGPSLKASPWAECPGSGSAAWICPTRKRPKIK